jgi:hypothetical protein
VFAEERPVDEFIPRSDGDTTVRCTHDGQQVLVPVGWYPCDDGTAFYTSIGTYAGQGRTGDVWHVDVPIDLGDCDPDGDNESGSQAAWTACGRRLVRVSLRPLAESALARPAARTTGCQVLGMTVDADPAVADGPVPAQDGTI